MDDNAYDAGSRMLLRRPHAEAELAGKLRTQGFAGDEVAAAVTRLRDEHHLDDAALAASLVRWHVEHRPSGRRAVRQRLLLKQLPAEHVEAALTEQLTAEIERDCAQRALEGRLRRSDLVAVPPAKRRDRLARFLLGRGFGSELVVNLLDHVLSDA